MFTITAFYPIYPFLLERPNKFLKKPVQTSLAFPNAREGDVVVQLCNTQPLCWTWCFVSYNPKNTTVSTVPIKMACQISILDVIQSGVGPTDSDIHTAYPLSSPKRLIPTVVFLLFTLFDRFSAFNVANLPIKKCPYARVGSPPCRGCTRR